MEYNGFKNKATWEVALYLGNDFGWYQIAKAVKRYPQPFLSFRKQVMDSFSTTFTKDGVSLWDEDLDIKELDDAIKEF
jgi:hypothetical protein